ncbi:MAG: EAL domain-containing protein [candidate division Zixibacteria bacterium]|nr:EAL domain-containing protein [candidate division Zixibacteria bacterium]
MRSNLDNISNWQFEMRSSVDSRTGLAELRRWHADVILIDYHLEHETGLTALGKIREAGIDRPVIIITRKGDEKLAVEAMKNGAEDYLNKENIDASTLDHSIRWAIERYHEKKFLSDTQELEHHLAYHDHLTNLPNRKLLMDRLHQAITQGYRSGQCLAVMFIDLDDFKDINDTFDHSAGDLVLQLTAQRLKSCVRESDTVARFGGDEFLIILNSIAGAQDAARVAEKIGHVMREKITLQDKQVRISASIGISMFPADSGQINSLLKNADKAMYRAKKSRNEFRFFHSVMNDNIEALIKSERNLNQAIKSDGLSLSYQPVIRTDSGNVIAMEALVRWKHPKAGEISPGEFLPMAEETGLINKLGEWVVNRASMQSDQWRKEGLNSKVSINVSRRQMMNRKFPKSIRKILLHAELDPKDFSVEISESAFQNGYEDIISGLKYLHEFGVGISIDDFGIGHMSIRELNSLPVDTVKIDSSLINDITVNRETENIVKAIIDMAHNLGLQAVAKGVETVEQDRLLRIHKCDQGQGYLYSPAVPGNDAADILAGKICLSETAGETAQFDNNEILMK